MKNLVAATAAALMCSSLALAAQSTSPATPQPQTEQPRAMAAQGTTVLTGCVYQEKDVPGRAPNVAERAGVLEDFILADVRPAQSPATATGTAGATGTSGTADVKAGSMYKLEHADDDKLRAMVGKRVEVTGRIDAERGDAKSPSAAPPASDTDRAIGRDRVDLPEFEISAIKEVSGTCPAAPVKR